MSTHVQGISCCTNTSTSTGCAHHDTRLSPTQLKEHGNRLFALGRLRDALTCYTAAHERAPNCATYLSNRALVYLKLGDWHRAMEDSRRALELDPNNVKACFFLGHALLELEFFEESATHLMRAHEAAREQRLNFGDDITVMIRRGRRLRFEAAERKRVAQEVVLQTYLTGLIVRDTEQRADAVRLRHQSEKSDKQELSEELEELETESRERLKELQHLFESADERCHRKELPDYLCGRISFELMRQPVITPCGITYDRKDIDEHLQRVGHFDPVTRQALTVDKLVPNLAMKEVVDSFLEANPWAEDY